MTDELGYMRVVSSKELTSEEQATYNKMIMDVLSDGYKDLMNISTKEIAPLMNISIRGVEICRYRVRKKLNIDRDQNLTSMIINL